MPRETLRITGRLSRHPDGYGFVIPEDPLLGEDVFIPSHRMGNASHGDYVVALAQPRRQTGRPRGRRGGYEGEIIQVLAWGRDSIVGKLVRFRDTFFVAPLDARMHFTVRIRSEGERPARLSQMEGKIVAVALSSPPGKQAHPDGEIVEILGDPDDAEIQYKIVCYSYGIPLRFPDAVLQEAETAREPGDKELSDRRDFRQQPAVTIDGETARDFDDAVSVERLDKGCFRLFVHIADVGHYVPWGSALDLEASLRGTSVYFPDRAIPMLPPRLSTDLCSLNPSEDRLTMTVVMEVGRDGEVLGSDFCKSVIRSRARMTYTEVKRILLDQDPVLRKRYAALLLQFEWMLELAQILTAKRMKRGATDFDLPEAEIEYDTSGDVLDIVRSERNQAHRIIEEFMLLANETVASHLASSNVPLIFRVHEEPDTQKVEQFQEIALKFGYGLERTEKRGFHPRDFQKMIQKFAGKKEEKFLSYLMLRSFKQARYSHENPGHFGLATTYYTHFTSPIRRYPDLIIHRVLKALIEKRQKTPAMTALYERLPEISAHSSDRERKAMEAEREIMRWFMAEFMADRIGDEFDAFVIGVKHNGFFVELLQHFVEGFVPVETLWDDFYVFDERHHCLVGENTRNAYHTGDQVRVRVDKVDPHRHLIDFSVITTGRKERRKRWR
ncbi:MAG: ribonuclease R [Acidobacteria bacterium]|nr:ribonuclease R [Acidobacteriota bacterium]